MIENNVKNIDGLDVHQYSIIQNNRTNLDMPQILMKKITGISLYLEEHPNTYSVEDYLNDLFNGDKKDFRPHFIIDSNQVWQILPLKLCGWHSGKGGDVRNRQHISILCIDIHAFGSVRQLMATLMYQFNISTDDIYLSDGFSSIDFKSEKEELKQMVIDRKILHGDKVILPFKINSNFWKNCSTDGEIYSIKTPIQNFECEGIEFRTHTINGKWTEWTTGVAYKINRSPIDLIEFRSPQYEIYYKVGKMIGKMSKWQSSGSYGQQINRIQIYVIKKEGEEC
jgi:hypothetical protein